MPINLTTPFAVTNFGRLVINQIRVDEDAQLLNFTVNLRTAIGGSPPDSTVASVRLQIRAGSGDQVRRNTAPTAGGRHDDLLLLFPQAVTTASAFTNAYAAMKTSRAALEAHLLAAGYIHSTLAGT